MVTPLQGLGHSLKLLKKTMPIGPQIRDERVVSVWNSLDNQSVTASSLNSFKE